MVTNVTIGEIKPILIREIRTIVFKYDEKYVSINQPKTLSDTPEETLLHAIFENDEFIKDFLDYELTCLDLDENGEYFEAYIKVNDSQCHYLIDKYIDDNHYIVTINNTKF